MRRSASQCVEQYVLLEIQMWGSFGYGNLAPHSCGPLFHAFLFHWSSGLRVVPWSKTIGPAGLLLQCCDRGCAAVVATIRHTDCPDHQGNHQGIGCAANHQGKGWGAITHNLDIPLTIGFHSAHVFLFGISFANFLISQSTSFSIIIIFPAPCSAFFLWRVRICVCVRFWCLADPGGPVSDTWAKPHIFGQPPYDAAAPISYIHTYMHACKYIHTCTHTYTHTYIYRYIYIYIYIYTYIQTYTQSLQITIYIHIHTYIYIYTHIHTYIHTYTLTYLPTYLQTYMYIYMHIFINWILPLLGLPPPSPPPYFAD